MGRFEKEYQQTKRRNQRARQNMNINNSNFNMNINSNRAMTVGFGTRRGNFQKQGDSGIDNFMSANNTTRNRMNPVFGANLPKVGAQLGFGVVGNRR